MSEHTFCHNEWMSIYFHFFALAMFQSKPSRSNRRKQQPLAAAFGFPSSVQPHMSEVNANNSLADPFPSMMEREARRQNITAQRRASFSNRPSPQPLQPLRVCGNMGKMVQPSAQKESPQIPFVTRLCVGHVDDPKHISFAELDSTFDLGRTCFIEVVDNPKYVRPYFIFNIKRLDYDLYDDIIDWLYSLEDVFGEVSIGGVCTNIDMSDYTGLPFTDCDLGNYLIIHAVYFHSCITANDMMEIIKERVVHEAADRSIYRLNDGPLLFKHICSPTRFRKSLNQNDRGMIMNNLPKSSQIIRVRGDEELISKARWEEVFPLKSIRQSRAKSRSALRRERRKAKKQSEKCLPQPQPCERMNENACACVDTCLHPQPCKDMDDLLRGRTREDGVGACLRRQQHQEDVGACLRRQQHQEDVGEIAHACVDTCLRQQTHQEDAGACVGKLLRPQTCEKDAGACLRRQPCKDMGASSSESLPNDSFDECLQRPQPCERMDDTLRAFKNTIMGIVPPEESTEINELIFLDKSSLLDMLAFVNAGSPNNIRKVIGIMARSPYPKQFIIRILQEWYDKIPHKSSDTMSSWVDQHYQYEETNQWFFSIVKLFDDERTRNWYKQVYTRKKYDANH